MMSTEEENGETETSRVRVFVGGLGEGVTADDLQRLFESLGSVDGVEIIRTKGRSFAYVDFMPSPTDQKSLSKLFSRYNGCLWKGGKLKLEKAKEHYLVRLKREWEEDAKLVNNEPGTSTDSDKSVSSKEMPSRESLMTKQLRIFFPKLRKVKSIPFSGTGKHKYSFPKVEVPPLPLHFCDCEEHSSPSGVVGKKQSYNAEPETGGMKDEEINIMNAVMNKLFEKEMVSGSMHYEKEQKPHGSPTSVQSDEHEVDSATDDDDLIINIETKKKKTALTSSEELERILGNQESGFNEARLSEKEQTKNKLGVPKSKNVAPDEKRTSFLNLEEKSNAYTSAAPGAKGHMLTLPSEMSSGEQTTESGHVFREPTKVSWSQKSSWRELLSGNGAFNTSQVLPSSNSSEEEQGSDGLRAPKSTDTKTEPTEMVEGGMENTPSTMEVIERLTEAQPTKNSSASDQSGRGAAWRQKQSWTQLVSQNDSSFSISQIFPKSTFQKPTTKEPIVDLAFSSGCKHNGLADDTNKESVGDGFSLVKSTLEKKHNGLVKPTNNEFVGDGFNLVKGATDENQYVAGNDVTPAQIIEEKCETEANKTSTDIKIGETCSFMRSAASLREWTKTKAALSRSLKRKRGEKKEQ